MTGTTPIDVIIQGDCLVEMKRLPDESIDAIVTDPPYELAFMGKKWDASGIAYNVDMWGECLRVLKPGGHLLAFGGSRTYHRMACAIEDAGFEIRDSIHWVYGSGFPKSLDISKALDKAANAEREVISVAKRSNAKGSITNYSKWERPEEYDITAPATSAAKQWAGWGSALKPAHEPVVLARKPLDGCTIAENVLRWGCGGLNVDGCRIEVSDRKQYEFNHAGRSRGDTSRTKNLYSGFNYEKENPSLIGRFPSNLIHDGSPDVLAEFAKAGERKVGFFNGHRNKPKTKNDFGIFKLQDEAPSHEASTGSAARFFMACEFTPADYAPIVYYAKAAPSERNGSTHPTMKPLSLMRYLCKLITPPGGTILDPFGGSGTTGIAAIKEGFHYILIEQQEEYCEIARKRVAAVPARLDRWAEEGI